MKTPRVLAIVALGAVFLGAQGAEPIEWPHYGGDAGHGKYSTAADITADNASALAPAWTWQTVDRPVPDTTCGPADSKRHQS